MSPVDMPRRMQSLSATRAVRGSNSEIDRPGTVVAIGPNSPRTSAGASGLGSQVECWGGPPIRNSTMHDLARPKDEPHAGVPAAAAPGRSRSAKRQPRAETAQAADPHHLTAVPAITEPNTRSEKTEHRSLSAMDPEPEKQLLNKADCSDIADGDQGFSSSAPS